MSTTELSREAIELEKRSIQLTVEEGKLKFRHVLQFKYLPNSFFFLSNC